jgi:hypothetical protein
MNKILNLLEYIVKEYIDDAILELTENIDYGLSKGAEISFIIYSTYLKKITFKKCLPGTKYYKIKINPSDSELYGENIFMVIFQRKSDIKMSEAEYIYNNIQSRFHEKGKIEFI